MNYWLSFSPNTFLSGPDADRCMCDVIENDYEEPCVETEGKEPQTVTVPLVEEFPAVYLATRGDPGVAQRLLS
ncbi:MAG TPA: hypothetical protein VEC02_05240 [Nitrososphaerales archaeon]|nr:hypothetical protein [Nitrososphaerales archaeon]